MITAAFAMRNLTATLCLTLVLLLGSANAQTGSTRDPLILSLIKDGRIYLNENLVSLENLVSSLIAIRSSNPEKVSMYFRVDQAATYSQMQIVMKAMKQAGFVRGKLVGEGMPIWLVEYTPPHE